MAFEVVIERLSAHPQVLPMLQQWFEAEWPAWCGRYGDEAGFNRPG